MATTFPLIAKGKIDTRKNGDVSFAQVTIDIDGFEYGATFRAKVGDEPVVIDGRTITVSDDQAATACRIAATQRTEIEARAAAQAAAVARFGTLAPIAAVSDAQRRYAEAERLAKLPLILPELERRAGGDADTLDRALALVAAQADPDFWIRTDTDFRRVGTKLSLEHLFYHFA